MTCRNCHKKRVCRPRGLCWDCYYRPGVRDRYPSTNKFAHRGVGNFTGSGRMPAVPTATAPGSAERVAVLAERAARGERLDHPGDVRLAAAGGGE